MTGDGKLLRMEKDYASVVDAKLTEANALAENGNTNESIEILLSLEKQTRTGSDTLSTVRILEAVVKICFKYKLFELLNENIILLSKRRGQIPQAATKMIQEAFSYVEMIDDKAVKLKLIETLRLVTDGKIYVEVERARLTRILSEILEKDGKVDEAAKVMQELQVETFGSMDKQEKIEFLLEQMRLSLAKKDYVITQIISKKISPKFFKSKDSDEVQKLKLKYYNQLIEYNLHDSAYIEVCKHYFAIHDTPSIQKDENTRYDIQRNIILYICLSTYNNEQSDMLARVNKMDPLPSKDRFMGILLLFTTDEIINWAEFEQVFGNFLTRNEPGLSIFPQTDVGKKRWEDLKARVVGHNVRVMSKYYTQITLKRMASLLVLTIEETEKCLADIVSKGTIPAKMDRLLSVVHFTKAKSANDVLNEWSENINNLMKMLSESTHLITKEEMVYKMF